jgi:hypothetical protein
VAEDLPLREAGLALLLLVLASGSFLGVVAELVRGVR